MKVQINGYEVSWPEHALGNDEEFLLETQTSGGQSIILLRKTESPDYQYPGGEDRLTTFFVPLEEEEEQPKTNKKGDNNKLIKMNKKKSKK